MKRANCGPGTDHGIRPLGMLATRKGELVHVYLDRCARCDKSLLCPICGRFKWNEAEFIDDAIRPLYFCSEKCKREFQETAKKEGHYPSILLDADRHERVVFARQVKPGEDVDFALSPDAKDQVPVVSAGVVTLPEVSCPSCKAELFLSTGSATVFCKLCGFHMSLKVNPDGKVPQPKLEDGVKP